MALDFARASAHKDPRMLQLPNNFYAQWRIRAGVVPLLRDHGDLPPERLLQAIWHHQRLQREQLRTGDGRPVRVLHPGFLNLEGGPDFRGAVIQFGEDTPRMGDVEVDLRPSGWHGHGHDRNPAFSKVILHAVWEAGDPVVGAPPMLPLRAVLDSPLGALSLWLGDESAQGWPEELRGRCCAPLRQLSLTQVLSLLCEAAQVRLCGKAAHLQARGRQVGWEQCLWEGLFRALGYKHNVWPMQNLGELRPRWSPERAPVLTLEARLLGISGLLPAEVPSPSRADGQYLRKLWDEWWRERDAFSDCLMPRELWRLHGLRPANHPQRRLALASRWAADGTLAARLEQWCAREVPEKELAGSLLELLQAPSDDFWSWHYTLLSGRLSHTQPLLGETRTTDLAMNVALPWLWARASEGCSVVLQQSIQGRFFAWPAAEDNSLLRLARERLLGGHPRELFRTAAAQQGLIQLVRDNCEHSNAICEDCHLPKLVHELCRSNANPGFPQRL